MKTALAWLIVLAVVALVLWSLVDAALDDPRITGAILFVVVLVIAWGWATHHLMFNRRR